jgi:hypothetical protein
MANANTNQSEGCETHPESQPPVCTVGYHPIAGTNCSVFFSLLLSCLCETLRTDR